jgi:hypothetical protein
VEVKGDGVVADRPAERVGEHALGAVDVGATLPKGVLQLAVADSVSPRRPYRARYWGEPGGNTRKFSARLNFR